MTNTEQSKSYQKAKQQLTRFQMILNIVLLILLMETGLTYQLRNFCNLFFFNYYFSIALYITIFYVGFSIINFPFFYFNGYVLECKYQQSNQTFQEWLRDQIKALLLNFALFLILSEMLYAFLITLDENWWIGAGVFWLFLSIVLTKIMPTMIIPLFFKYINLDNVQLKDKIFKLFKKCQVELKDIYIVNFSEKTKKVNAFLCGWGTNRRVVLSDTLLESFSDDEIEVVVAHELGHYKHRDILKLTLANTIVVFTTLYLAALFFSWKGYSAYGLTDIAFLPMFILIFIPMGFCMTPLLNWFSRVIERQADQFSIEKTKRPDVFISMITKLGEMNLAEFKPNKWTEFFFYNHPSISRRIEFAKKYE